MDVGAGVGSRSDNSRSDKKTGPRRFVRLLLYVVVILGSLADLVWLVATQHDELGRAIAGVGHAKLRWSCPACRRRCRCC